jgi:hypothetical protein
MFLSFCNKHQFFSFKFPAVLQLQAPYVDRLIVLLEDFLGEAYDSIEQKKSANQHASYQ